MRLLKYKGNFINNEVWVNYRTTMYDKVAPNILLKLFGSDSIDDNSIIKLRFSVAKDKPCWVEIRGKRVEFTYKIGQTGLGITNREYLLTFMVKQNITRGIDHLGVEVSSGSYSRKEIIKFLLDELIKKIN